MSKTISKTQIDRLGERLKKGPTEESDLKLLEEYRKSFRDAYQSVIEQIQTIIYSIPFGKDYKIELAGRPEKSTISIIEKLNRESSIRLSQLQDIAGCRLVVPDILEQDRIVSLLKKQFPNAPVIDRRSQPSHGYRAIHILVKHSEKLIEIQLRSQLQHEWAELSEKLADKVDHAIKYGYGHPKILSFLYNLSVKINTCEQAELATLLETQEKGSE